jgi:hypothetical protein
MDIIASVFFFLSGGADSPLIFWFSHFLFCGWTLWVRTEVADTLG